MRSQRGISAVGFLILAAVVGALAYAALRLVPVYLNQFKVAKILTDMKAEYDGQNATPAALQAAIGQRLDLEMIDFPAVRDFRIEKTASGYRISVAYEDRAPYAGNLSIVADFDNSVEIRR